MPGLLGLVERLGGWDAPRSARRVVVSWCATRLAMVGLVLTGLSQTWPFGTGDSAGDVLVYYLPAHHSLWSGQLPYRDFLFQYPPGALLFMLLPPGHTGRALFLVTYLAQMLVLDAVVLRLLLRSGLPAATAAGWLWTLGGAATLGLLLARTDLPAIVTVVAALLLFGRARERSAALALGIGGLTKVWPVLLLPIFALARPGFARRVVGPLTALTTATATVLIATGTMAGLYRDLVTYHGDRGVEVEAIGALPTLLASGLRLKGAPVGSGSGSLNLLHSTGLGKALTLLTLLALVAVLALIARAARRRGGLDGGVVAIAACALVGTSLLTSKVFSAQYLSWLLATAVVAAAYGTLSPRAGRLLLATIANTALVFPLDFGGLGTGGAFGLLPLAVLVSRDLLCGWLVALWLRELWVYGMKVEAADMTTGIAAGTRPPESLSLQR